MEDLVKIKRRIEMVPVPRRVKFRVKGLFEFKPFISVVILICLVILGWDSGCRVVSRGFGKPAEAIVEQGKTWVTKGKTGKWEHAGFLVGTALPRCPPAVLV